MTWPIDIRNEARQLAEIAHRKPPACKDVHVLLFDYVTRVRRKLRELKQMEKALLRLKAKYQNGTLNECPVIDELAR